MVREGVQLAVIGAMAGVAGGLALTRLMRGILFEVRTTDPWVLIGVALLMFVVSSVASLLPGIPAGSVDPIEALRCE